MIRDYKLNGFTAPILVPLTDELDAVRRLIYQLTKDKLENHSDDLSLEDKLNINFKSIPSESFWSKLMNTVNKSNELKTLINCEKIKNTFKKIFKYPEILLYQHSERVYQVKKELFMIGIKMRELGT